MSEKKKNFLFVTYTIIQSITSSEMCSLHSTHPSAHTPGAVFTHTHLEQWTHTLTHTWSNGHTHSHTHTWSSGHTHSHTHLEQWAADAVRCLAQGSRLNRGKFLPEPRLKPTTSGYKSNAQSIRPRLPIRFATKVSTPLSENVQIGPKMSICCVATIIFQHCLNPLGHGVHQSFTGCHWSPLPLLHDGAGGF